MKSLFGTISEFTHKIVSSDLPSATKKKSLKLIIAWGTLEKSQPLSVPGVKEMLLSAYKEKEMCGKAAKCLSQSMEKTRFARVFEDQSLREICEGFFASDMLPFLSELLATTSALLLQVPRSCEKQIRSYGGVVFAVGYNYSVLIFRVSLISVFDRTTRCASRCSIYLCSSAEQWTKKFCLIVLKCGKRSRTL